MSIISAMRVEKYFPGPRRGAAALIATRYVGPNLRRIENLSYEAENDFHHGIQERSSDDDGKTWSAWQTLHSQWPTQRDCTKEEHNFATAYDPASGKEVRMVLQRIIIGEGGRAVDRLFGGAKVFFDHMLWQTSDDGARTWSPQTLIKYEPGPDYDPNDWGPGNYLGKNEMYGGYNLLATRAGTLVYPVSLFVPYCDDAFEQTLEHFGIFGRIGGMMIVVGKWNAAAKTYEWQASNKLNLPRRVSSRGLMEPAVAELKSGRLLISVRGSNMGMDPVKQPSRNWMTTSDDGGLTWSPITDLRFDTGEQFYSPSAFARMLRHSQTGKLYWFGNITPEPPLGNGPRYPLVVAEVDEDKIALKKNTLSVIDTRDPEHDSVNVQFSNFSLLENRTTHELEIYLTRYGVHSNPEDAFTADAWKYTFRLS